jgi:hypothetical protein
MDKMTNWCNHRSWFVLSLHMFMCPLEHSLGGYECQTWLGISPNFFEILCDWGKGQTYGGGICNNVFILTTFNFSTNLTFL